MEKSISCCFSCSKKKRKKEKELEKKLHFFFFLIFIKTRVWEAVGNLKESEVIGKSLSPNNWFWFWPGPLAFSPFIKLRLPGKSWYHFAWWRGDSCLLLYVGARYFSVAAFSDLCSVLLLCIHLKVRTYYIYCNFNLMFRIFFFLVNTGPEVLR